MTTPSQTSPITLRHPWRITVRRIAGVVLLLSGLFIGIGGAAVAFVGAALLGVTTPALLLALAALVGMALGGSLSLGGFRLIGMQSALPAARWFALGTALLSAGIGWYGAIRQPAYPPSYLTPIGDLTEPEWLPIHWEPLTLGDQTFDRAALLVPIRLNGITETAYLQLDTGAPATMLYEQALESLLHTNPALRTHLDRNDPIFRAAGHDLFVFTDAAISMSDNVGFAAAKLPVLPGFGEARSESAPHVIGTLGADAFSTMTLLIDYRNGRIALTTTPPGADSFMLVDATVENYRFKIPLTVDGRQRTFLFDTGASLFSILTTEATWRSLVGAQADIEALPGVASWGVDYTVYGADVQGAVHIGTRELPSVRAYYHPAPFFVLIPVRNQVAGLVGNELFRTNIVALDFPGRQFGIALCERDPFCQAASARR